MVGFFRFNHEYGNTGIVHSAGAIYDILGQLNAMLSQVNELNYNYLHPLLSED
jgi:hypothetical protein